jgi:serine/threonine protein kinase
MKAKSYKCSPYWSAPELWSPLHGFVTKYTNKVDIWSLGIYNNFLIFSKVLFEV